MDRLTVAQKRVAVLFATLIVWRLILPVHQCGLITSSGRFIPNTVRWLPFPWERTCLKPSVNLTATFLQIVVIALIGAGIMWAMRPSKTVGPNTQAVLAPGRCREKMSIARGVP